MKRSVKSVLLIIPFALAYFVARSLPVEPCDFLHEETYNEQGELDYCGPGDTGFVDLTIRKWPLTMSLRPLGDVILNEPCDFEINLKEFDGSPLSANEVALSHTEKIHLMAVDPSLEDYQHLHPIPDSLFDGIWRFTFTPKRTGEYKIFLDLIPIRSPRRVLLSGSFIVKGEDKNETKIVKGHVTHASLGDRNFTLEINQDDSSSDELILTLRARDSDGNPLKLRPVMGAHAHMVAFDWDRKGFAHLHPLELEGLFGPVTESTTNDLQFSFTSSQIDECRIWAQVLLEDDQSETFVPFSLNLSDRFYDTN